MGDFDIEDCLRESIINYYSGELESCQVNDLLFWINQSPENLEYFRQLGRIWLATGVLSEHIFDTDRALGSVKLDRNRHSDNK